MAALSRTLVATFSVGAAAFAPSGGLHSATQQLGAGQGQQRQHSARATALGQMPLTAAGIAAAGIAAVALRTRSSTKASRIVRGAERPYYPAGYDTFSDKEAGVCFPLAEKWDPMNLSSSDMKMDRYTAVEIKHGRVAMIACIGYFMPEVFRFPGCENFEHGLAALSSIPVEGWVQLLAFVGGHEVLLKPGTRVGAINGGDYGFGVEVYEGVSETERLRRQTVERNNGRLAMIAIMGLMVQDGLFGMTPVQVIMKNGFYGPPVDFIIKDIPACLGYTYCATSQRSSRTIMRSGYSEIYSKYENGRYPPAEGEAWFDFPSPGEEPEMSPSMPFLTMPLHLRGWVGGEKGFDPLGCTDALPVYFMREAELKHGRVSMLAVLGWIATDLGLRFGGDIYQVSTMQAHDAMVREGQMQPLLGAIAVAEFYCGWLFLKGWGGEIDRSAGDFFFGKNFYPKEREAQKDMQLKEIENGRLAMLAFSGIATAAALTSKTWPFL